MQNSLKFIPRSVNKKRKTDSTTTRSHESSRLKQVKLTRQDAKAAPRSGRQDLTVTLTTSECNRNVSIGREQGSSKLKDERIGKANQLEINSSKQYTNDYKEDSEYTSLKSDKDAGVDHCFQTLPNPDRSDKTVLSAIENQAHPPYKDIGCLSPRKHIAVYQRQSMAHHINGQEFKQNVRAEYSGQHSTNVSWTPQNSGQYDSNASWALQNSGQYDPNASWALQNSGQYDSNASWALQNAGQYNSNLIWIPQDSGQYNSNMSQIPQYSGQTYSNESWTPQYSYQHYSNVCWTPQYYQESMRAQTQVYDDYYSRASHHIEQERTFGHPREWEYTRFGYSHIQQPSWRRSTEFDFTVMSYNVLAQNLLEDNIYLYNHCPKRVLDWDHRKSLLLEEIKAYRPDILCLQEVHSSHFQDFFKPELSEMGYSGQFVKRTGDKEDGCATFYKKRMFSLDKAVVINYKHPNGGELTDRDNVALILKLIPKLKNVPHGKDHCKTLKRLCVSNTHLLFNPRRGDIKLVQLMMLLAELDKCGHLKDESNRNSYHGLVMCGDFNLQPHSDLYRLLAMGRLDFVGLQKQTMSGQELDFRRSSGPRLSQHFLPTALGINDNCQYCEVVNKRNKSDTNPDDDCKVITNVQGTGILSHQLKLLSAYTHRVGRYEGYDVEEVTTHHGRANSTVDYIFYGINSGETALRNQQVRVRHVREGPLRLVGRYGLLTGDELDQMGSLPNKRLGSDHLCIMARFVLL